MNKVVAGLIGSMLLSGIVFAADTEATDFTKLSNKELVNLSGKVEPKEIRSYEKEIEARIDEMTMKEANEFRTQIKDQEKKVYDNMKVKDFKVRQKALAEAKRDRGPQGECTCGGPQGKGFDKRGRQAPHGNQDKGNFQTPPPNFGDANEPRSSNDSSVNDSDNKVFSMNDNRGADKVVHLSF